MKSKNIKIKKLISFILTVALCFGVFHSVFATDLIITGKITPELSEATMRTKVSDLLGFFQYFCWALAVGMIIYIGIRYMAASTNDKADLKSGLVRYVIGVIMLAVASTVVKALWDFFSSVSE